MNIEQTRMKAYMISKLYKTDKRKLTKHRVISIYSIWTYECFDNNYRVAMLSKFVSNCSRNNHARFGIDRAIVISQN